LVIGDHLRADRGDDPLTPFAIAANSALSAALTAALIATVAPETRYDHRSLHVP
jgi:hypothetical protein